MSLELGDPNWVPKFGIADENSPSMRIEIVSPSPLVPATWLKAIVAPRRLRGEAKKKASPTGRLCVES